MNRLSDNFGKQAPSHLLSSLLYVRGTLEDGTADTTRGLCSLTNDYLAEFGYEARKAALKVRDHLYTRWPAFSGCMVYPVPGTGSDSDDNIVAAQCEENYGGELDFDDKGKVAEWYFEAVGADALNGGNFWTSAYGEKRRQLLDFMIDELTKEAVQ